MGNGCADIVVIVEHGEPGAHSVRYLLDHAGIHTVLPETKQHILPGSVGIHQGDEHWIQLHIAQVLSYVPADTAVDIANLSGVPAAGNVGTGRISLDIHKDATDDHDAHRLTPSKGPRVLPGIIVRFFLFYHINRMKNNRKTA